MSIMTAFAPHYTRGQTVAPGVASQTVRAGRNSKALCLTNFGTGPVYIRVFREADNAPGIAATLADYPVPAGAQVTISKGMDQDSIAFISPGGAGSMHIISGEGY